MSSRLTDLSGRKKGKEGRETAATEIVSELLAVFRRARERRRGKWRKNLLTHIREIQSTKKRKRVDLIRSKPTYN